MLGWFSGEDASPTAGEGSDQAAATTGVEGEPSAQAEEVRWKLENDQWLGNTIAYCKWCPPEPPGAGLGHVQIPAASENSTAEKPAGGDSGSAAPPVSPFKDPEAARAAAEAIPELVPASQPASIEAGWDVGSAEAFQLRSGPDYLNVGNKEKSAPAMYRCVSVDAVRTETYAITQALGGIQPLPPAAEGCDWRPEDVVPRVLSVVMILPYTLDMGWSSTEDFGCSVVSVSVIEPETLRASRGSTEDMSPAVRLFCKWLAEGEVKLGDKSTSNVLKAIAFCENLEDLAESIPGLQSALQPFNAMPALITQSGTLRRDPSEAKEWLEIVFDVRMWCFAARAAIYNLRSALPSAVMQSCLVLQGVEDEELPERVLCTGRITGFDLMRTPVVLRTEPPAQQPGPDEEKGTESPAANGDGTA